MAINDQKGTITVDTQKISERNKDQPNQLGAQAIGHESQHDLDAKANGIANTEAKVRVAETNAYGTSRAIDAGFGKSWPQSKFDDAVNESVDHFLIRQEQIREANEK